MTDPREIPAAKVLRGAKDVGPDKTDSPKRGLFWDDAVHIQANLREIEVPNECACCGVAVEARQIVPYCGRCRVHNWRWFGLRLAVGAGAVGLGLTAKEWLPGVMPMIGIVAYTTLVFIAVLVAPLATLLVKSLRAPGGTCAHFGTAVSYSSAGATFRRLRFGTAVASMNKLKCERIRVPRFEPQALLLALLALPTLVAGLAAYHYDDWHETLFIDNGLDTTVTISVKGGSEVVKVAPKTYKKIAVPHATLELVAVSGGEQIDIISLGPIQHLQPGPPVLAWDSAIDTAVDFVYIWNIASKNCYREHTQEYSNHNFAIGSNEVGYRIGRLFGTTADKPFEPLPDSVESPVGMAFRTELRRISCDALPGGPDR